MRETKKAKGTVVKTGNKPLIIGILIFAVLAAAAAIAIPIILERRSNNEVVAKVNGIPISALEFKQVVASHRAMTYSYFYQKYGVEDSTDFWTSSYGGENPAAYARKSALDELVRVKLEQSLAREKGILEDLDYGAFRKELEKENARRKEAIRKGQVIYGPEQYGEREYFSYVHSNMVIKLKEKLGEKELAADDNQIRVYYESNKDKLYKKQDSIKVQKLIIVPTKDRNALNALKTELKAKIDALKANKISFDTAAGAYKEDQRFKTELTEQSFDPEKEQQSKEGNDPVSEEARQLKPGQVSGLIEAPEGLVLMRCTERKDNGYQSFEEVKSNVKNHRIDEGYEEMLKELMKEAKIEVYNIEKG